jgi:protein-tyrosine phosphatase
MSQIKVLFICLGNICRSPAAEGVLKHLAKQKKLVIEVDSCGTSALHSGEKADARMREAALKRGIDLTSLSRQFVLSDFEQFDYLLTMDDSNYESILALDHKHQYDKKIFKMSDFLNSPKFRSLDKIPDPYYGQEDGFELVLDLLEDSCLYFMDKKLYRVINP